MPSPEPHPPLTLERYEILEEIGRGGFAAVYLARQRSTGQRCAIKTLLLPPDKDPDRHLARFKREMALLGSVQSPHIVRLYDSGITEAGQPYMVLELIEGEPLSQHIAESPSGLDPAFVKRVMLDTLHALADAHDHGVVHRDLKPENIMVTGVGTRISAYVLDFGIAGLLERAEITVERDDMTMNIRNITVAGDLYGTPHYMAPEQLLEFHNPVPTTDLYAAGLILFEMLTGRVAVDGDTTNALIFKHCVAPLEFPVSLEESVWRPFIERACAKKPQDRFPSAEAMLEALEEIPATATLRVNTNELAFAETDAIGADAVRLAAATAPQSALGPDTLERVTAPELPPEPTPPPEQQSYRRPAWLLPLLLFVLISGAALIFLLRASGSTSNAAPAPEASAPVRQDDRMSAVPKAWIQVLEQGTIMGLSGITQRNERMQAFLVQSMMQARLAAREQRYEDALALYRGVLEKDPENVDAMTGLGLAFVGLGQWDEALAWLRKAAEREPMREDTLFGLAQATAGQGQREEAIERYDVFLKTFPDSERGDTARFELAGLLVEADQPERARALYAQLLEQSPDSPHAEPALFALATLVEDEGELEEAQALFESYLERFPDGPHAKDARKRIKSIKRKRKRVKRPQRFD